ncbi:hypothetical protein KHM83_14965 [Fusibacter paucivorans]|uniref:Uncharacterized protein n=1 Tax=Fusibacter paucivorans TaxID=76009 RepID=A0ABS5PS43_9FIRM|nr:hypothetical protein [Fusibacter paucivorans]MBS7527984.1 hypothetical protein [Fusibacter paucivorans]
MKKEHIVMIGLIIIIIGTIWYGSFSSSRLTTENQQLLSQLTALKSQIDAIQSTQQAENQQLKLYEAIAEAQSDKVTHYQTILADQMAIMAAEGIDSGKYIHLYAFDDMWNPQMLYFINNETLLNASGMSDITANDAENMLNDVIQRMSAEIFDYLPIQLEKLESDSETDGYCAYINLEELPNAENDDQYRGWLNRYFQGSSGGGSTERTLIYNVLQPDLNWWPVTSAVFTYQHETIYYDHVPELTEIVRRDDLVMIKE